MASNNPAAQRSDGQTCSSGRGWVSMDPERQCEVAGDGARSRSRGRNERGSVAATQAQATARRLTGAFERATVSPLRAWLQSDIDDEGGSGRRFR